MTTTALTATGLHTVVEAAIRAPSLHNSQPWRFRAHPDGIDIRLDRTRLLPIADPREWAARIACGAAAYNARLALATLGHTTTTRLRPDPTDPDLLIRLTCTAHRRITPAEQALYEAIPRRYSNRAPFWPPPVPADLRTALVDAARQENTWLELVIGTTAVDAVAEIARAAARVLDRNPAYHTELTHWTRTHHHTADGVPDWAGGTRQEPHDLLPTRPFTTRTRAPGRDYEPEPLIAVLGTAADTTTDHLTAGLALQRVLLTATHHGLATSMLSQPIEVEAAREHLRIALSRYGTPQLVLRIGYGQPGFPTPRRPAAEVTDP